MLRRIFTFKAFIVFLAALFAFTVYNQDVDSNVIALILTIIAVMLSDITTLLKKIHQLLLMQSERVVEQAVASFNEQRDEDPP